ARRQIIRSQDVAAAPAIVGIGVLDAVAVAVHAAAGAADRVEQGNSLAGCVADDASPRGIVRIGQECIMPTLPSRNRQSGAAADAEIVVVVRAIAWESLRGAMAASVRV